MNESLRKRRGSKEGFKSYGSTNYGSKEDVKVSYQTKQEVSVERIYKVEEEERVGKLKNDYYTQIRQEQKLSQDSGWFYEVIQDMISYIYQIVQFNTDNNVENKKEYPEPEIGIEDVYLEKLEEFKKYSNIPYNTENELHEKLLLKLWNLSCPNINLDERKSELWKDIGFQGIDPSTDFRGVGVFGLWNLVFFAQTYPKKYSKFLEKTKKDKNGYPMCIAGLNITMMLFDILGFGFQSKKIKNTEARKKFIELLCKSKGKFNNESWFEEDEIKEEILLDFGENNNKSNIKKKKKKIRNLFFEQLYVTGFIILHQEWYSMNANYFSFPKVIESTKTRLFDYLENDFNSIEDVIQFNKKKL